MIAEKMLSIVSADDRLKQKLFDTEQAYLDRASSMAYMKKKAMEEGIVQGIQQGIEKGIEQGIEQQKNKIAKSLLDVLDDETIAEKTGLTINQIKELRNKN